MQPFLNLFLLDLSQAGLTYSGLVERILLLVDNLLPKHQFFNSFKTIEGIVIGFDFFL